MQRERANNNILNAMHKGHTIAEFEGLPEHNWQPRAEAFKGLFKRVIEKGERTGKPWIGTNNFLVSMTADVAVGDVWKHVGDCDQSKWLDALIIPGLVLPGLSEFQTTKAPTRSFVVTKTLGQPEERIAYGNRNPLFSSSRGDFSRVDYPVTSKRVAAEVRTLFEAWGGNARLDGLLGEYSSLDRDPP